MAKERNHMADDLTNKGAADRSRINVNESHEVRYWMEALDVSEAKLRDLVSTHGVMVADVRRALAS